MRVLCLECDQHIADQIDRMLRAALSDCEDVARAERLSSGLDRLTAETFDLVFCALRLPDSRGGETVDRLLSVRPDVPVIVHCRQGDESSALQSVEHGADDFLVLGTIDAARLRQSALCAQARRRSRRTAASPSAAQREQWLRELGLLEGFSAEMRAAARNFSSGPLREARPHTFQELSDCYARVLDQSLEQRVLKVDHQLSEQLATLANALGRLAAVPRDVFDLHRAALESRVQGAPAARQEAFAAEGRLLMMGLMAKLVSYYRLRSVAIAEPRPTSKEPSHG